VTTIFLLHTVQDYGAWRQVYDEVGELQKAGGVTDEKVYQSTEDPNTVLVMHRFASADQAGAFLENPELRAAMGRAGVIESSMRIELFEEV
jgi:hypothetical protein